MAKKKWVVRVILSIDDRNDNKILDTAFLECLRYAGYARIQREDKTGMCVDLVCPHDGDSHQWALRNAERMGSFGFNAAAAPEMPSELP